MSNPTVEERFWSKVSKGPGCWLWTASQGVGGYGQFKRDDRMQRAHRVAYELLVGPIPNGLVIDHLCKVRTCVNPAHLEPVTQRENIRRGEMHTRRAEHSRRITHCPQGHPYSEENTRVKRGCRNCKACDRDRAQRKRDRARLEAESGTCSL